jgi:3-phenylpropionate/trans-cinnamate dioxygenase ferredoxin reductase subunit
MSPGTVIVGTGQSGFEVAAALRAGGYSEAITLIGDEPHLPYQRPPLSKDFVLDKSGLEQLELRPPVFYHNHHIAVIVGRRVVAIDRSDRRVCLSDGTQKHYEFLVLAVGARNRKLRVPGADLEGVAYLRSLDEAVALKTLLHKAERVVVVGGGFVGLEVASAAKTMGKSVTVIEMQHRLLSRVVAPEVSVFFETLHSAKGVNVVCGGSVCEILEESGKVDGVLLAQGAVLPADVVVVGIGVEPNTELASAAELAIGNGIAVDKCLRTSDDAIFAIGDCAEFPSRFAGGRVRLESVQNGVEQAACVASAIAGKARPYTSVPWLWTDQFDVRLQMAGLSIGFEQCLIQGDLSIGRFSAFYFKAGRLIAVDSMNRPVDHVHARRLLEADAVISLEQVRNPSFELRLCGR